MKSDGPLSVLFLCTGNSCRSQIAEAIVNADPNLPWKAYSAGTKPAESIHPRAIQVLEEIGIKHRGAPKTTDHFQDQSFDLVVTVCDSAAEECPVWLGSATKLHKSFIDPAKAKGSEQEVLRTFREVRDQIIGSIPRLLEDYNKNEG
jgi:arsenate reductase